MKRGEIYYANLGRGIGSEQGGIRPVVIVQNDIGNQNSRTVIIVPITTARKKWFPMHVLLRKARYVHPDSVVLTEQIRTVDKVRILRRIGRVHPEEMQKIESALQLSLGVNEYEKRTGRIHVADHERHDRTAFGSDRAAARGSA